jgi:hypothetical protein
MPGWVVLTHDNQGSAQALFFDAKGVRVPEPIQVIMDHRACSDTIFRAIRLSADIIVLSDIWTWNATIVHSKYPYSKRAQLIADILDMFHSPDLVAFVHPNDLPVGTLIRGQEWYDEQPGTLGVFLPAVE